MPSDRLDFGPFGITVNCVAPGPIATEMPMSILSKDQQDALAGERPWALGSTRRAGRPRRLPGQRSRELRHRHLSGGRWRCPGPRVLKTLRCMRHAEWDDQTGRKDSLAGASEPALAAGFPVSGFATNMCRYDVPVDVNEAGCQCERSSLRTVHHEPAKIKTLSTAAPTAMRPRASLNPCRSKPNRMCRLIDCAKR